MFKMLQSCADSCLALAWLLFLLSFFLPATDVVQRSGTPPGTPLCGWQACIDPIHCLMLKPLILIAEPRLLLLLLYPILNLVMFVAPLLARSMDECAVFLAPVLIASPFSVWLLPDEFMGELFLGFYCWTLSFVLMGMGCLLRTGSLMPGYGD